ncbi:hypothetical protein KIN20_012575 [Parelaphostrongylus tenuis]|uniref:Uncharacterized protein n=1 Tax=Parelaphostrongylus tenuis TaxID=148309 RepID=A0AAD5N168_PARTN|nr:hypothetical protein KIN20_012575 [Parelaphostrongylus tenuis]
MHQEATGIEPLDVHVRDENRKAPRSIASPLGHPQPNAPSEKGVEVAGDLGFMQIQHDAALAAGRPLKT